MKRNFTFQTIVISDVVSETVLSVGHTDTDFMLDLMRVKLEMEILTSFLGTRHVERTFKPPSFWDWLFKRQRKVTFVIHAREVIVNPPRLKNKKTIMQYIIK